MICSFILHCEIYTGFATSPTLVFRPGLFFLFVEGLLGTSTLTLPVLVVLLSDPADPAEL